jgi:hypothetical protein
MPHCTVAALYALYCILYVCMSYVILRDSPVICHAAPVEVVLVRGHDRELLEGLWVQVVVVAQHGHLVDGEGLDAVALLVLHQAWGERRGEGRGERRGERGGGREEWGERREEEGGGEEGGGREGRGREGM